MGFDFDSTVSPVTRKYFLQFDMSVECYASETHRELLGLMWAMAGLWPIGVVLIYALLLLKCLGPIRRGISTTLVMATGFLTRDYESHVFWWELLELLRSAAFFAASSSPLNTLDPARVDLLCAY